MWMPNDIFGNIFTMCTLDIDDLQLFHSKFIAHIKVRLDQLLKHMQMRILFLPEKNILSIFANSIILSMLWFVHTFMRRDSSIQLPTTFSGNEWCSNSSCKETSTWESEEHNVENIMFKRYLSLQMYFLIIYTQYPNRHSLGFLFGCCLPSVTHLENAFQCQV